MRHIRAVVCVLAVCFAAISTGNGADDAPTFRSESKLVLVQATVLDRFDRFVTDLSESNFRVFEGNEEQRIVSVAMESAPVSVGIVFDSSGSMKRARRSTVEAVRRFLRAADPGEEFCVVQVRDEPDLTMDFTSDMEEVQRLLDTSRLTGATALIDSVYLAASHMRHALHQRRMLLVISDGEDNNSRYSQRELRRMLEEANVTAYTVGIGVRKPLFFYVGASGADLLSEIAGATGGRYLPVANVEELPDIMRKVDIRYQYVIGFVPPPGGSDGRYHRIQLKVRNSDGLRAFWRPGYRSAEPAVQVGHRSAPRQKIPLTPQPRSPR